VNTTNANIVVAANNIKNKVIKIQNDTVQKTDQLNKVFKVGGLVKFLSNGKTKYMLGVTKTSFMNLCCFFKSHPERFPCRNGA